MGNRSNDQQDVEFTDGSEDGRTWARMAENATLASKVNIAFNHQLPAAADERDRNGVIAWQQSIWDQVCASILQTIGDSPRLRFRFSSSHYRNGFIDGVLDALKTKG